MQERIHKIRTKSTAALASTFLMMLIPFFSIGQYDDTAVYRKNNVKVVKSYVHFLQFENSNDTCLFEEKEVDRNGLLTLVRQNYGCQGTNIIAETKFEYDKNLRLIKIESLQNDNLLSLVKLEYDQQNRVIKEEGRFTDPFLVQLISHIYYGPVGTPDSMRTLQVNNGDSLLLKTMFKYENGKQVRAEMIDLTNHEPVSKRVNKYNAKGLLIRDEFILMQSYDNDEITNFTYNEKGQIFRSQSEISKIAGEFYYNKFGLLAKTFYYNKFETLEREVWHKYTFWE